MSDEAICFFRDGSYWCCCFGDFKNLQESIAGFGRTYFQALRDLRDKFEEGSERYELVAVFIEELQ